MKKLKNISRKKFLKNIAEFFSIPTIYLWIKAVDRKIASMSKTKIILPSELPQGILFIDKIIVNKQGDNIKVFLSTCTHLGCRINSQKDNQLVCPCHGSKFSFEGIPSVGPAANPLVQLEVVNDSKTGEMIVYV